MGYGGDYDDFDYTQGQIAQIQQQTQQAQSANLSGLTGSSAGQIAVYDGVNFVAGSLVGVSNRVSTSFAGTTITISTPQDIGAGSSPTFANLTLTGTLQVGGGATLTKFLTATASLDFPNTAAQNSSDLTITVTGAAVGDAVALGIPTAAVNANSEYTAWVSAADVVTVRFSNFSAGAINPASGTFRAVVFKF